MKILNPYRFYRGHSSGSSSSPIPALVPPDMQNLLKSISIAETVDLLCEGPIYGLVDQFGKKVYGLDMLKGIYLNKTPVMNSDGKYNFRNVVMEINLGTENQKPLANFTNVYIYRPANFKLLGPINNEEMRNGIGDGSIDVRDLRRKSQENFSSWATGFPTDSKDPFVYVHHIKNKDVKKLKVSMIVESLFDTVDVGTSAGQSGKMGMSRSTELKVAVTVGVEGSDKVVVSYYSLLGTVQSPYACMLGESFSQFSSPSTMGSASSIGGGISYKSSAPSGSSGSRTVTTDPTQNKAQFLLGQQQE